MLKQSLGKYACKVEYKPLKGTYTDRVYSMRLSLCQQRKHMCTGIYLYRHALYRLEDIRLAGVNSRMML